MHSDRHSWGRPVLETAGAMSRRSPVGRTATVCCGTLGPGAGEGLLAGEPQFVVEQEKAC
jgi:hypothetical protein